MGRIYAGLAGLLLCSFPRAQAADAAFAAVSIKLSTIQRYDGVELKPGGRLTANNIGVLDLANAAFGLTGSGRLGKGPNCPNWVDTQKFDIEAVAEEDAIPGHLDAAQLRKKLQPLLQRLLAERFQLVVRRESKEMPVYKLTAAKSGAKLTEATVSETECRSSADCRKFLGNRMRGLHGAAVTMADLASALEATSDRPIVDETGIVGLFAVEVKPFATLKPQLSDFLESIPVDRRPPPEPVKPSLSSVLEKDLGLLLRPAKAVIETIQVDSVKMPSAN